MLKIAKNGLMVKTSRFGGRPSKIDSRRTHGHTMYMKIHAYVYTNNLVWEEDMFKFITGTR